MRDRELTERAGNGWTRWADGVGEYDIERTWWQAKVAFSEIERLMLV